MNLWQIPTNSKFLKPNNPDLPYLLANPYSILLSPHTCDVPLSSFFHPITLPGPPIGLKVFKYFLGVPHSATFIFVIFVYVIASIAYIHPVYGVGV